MAVQPEPIVEQQELLLFAIPERSAALAAQLLLLVGLLSTHLQLLAHSLRKDTKWRGMQK
jgi:hypothetical protein